MIHRTQDTYSLSHFRQNTGQHMKRIADGKVETITQNGEAAMVVMSPETYDRMRIRLERGQRWEQTVARIGEGKGRDAREVIHEIADSADLEL